MRLGRARSKVVPARPSLQTISKSTVVHTVKKSPPEDRYRASRPSASEVSIAGKVIPTGNSREEVSMTRYSVETKCNNKALVEYVFPRTSKGTEEDWEDKEERERIYRQTA